VPALVDVDGDRALIVEARPEPDGELPSAARLVAARQVNGQLRAAVPAHADAPVRDARVHDEAPEALAAELRERRSGHAHLHLAALADRDREAPGGGGFAVALKMRAIAVPRHTPRGAVTQPTGTVMVRPRSRVLAM
jgi:hypothetical protein